MQKGEAMTAVEDLAHWLSVYHPRYTVADIVPSPVKGYLHTTKACSCTRPPFDGYTVDVSSGRERTHTHTLDVSGYRTGYGRGIYAWWYALVREMPVLSVPHVGSEDPHHREP